MNTTHLKGLVRSIMAVSTLGSAMAFAAEPTPVDTTPFTVDGLCPFALTIQLSGKGASKELPGGRFIMTSPGAKAQLTNESNGRSATVNITGSFMTTVDASGGSVTDSRGRSLLFDPVAGFVLAIGNFSYAFDGAGNLVQPLSGTGKLTDVCSLVE